METKNKTYQELQEEFIASETKRISKLSNRVLYEETLALSSVGNYNGDFTDRGGITYNLLKKDLDSRLAAWLN